MRTMNVKMIAMTGILFLGAPLAATADVTKRDVQEMLQAQVSCQDILQYIRANAPVLPLTYGDLQDLRLLGANERVIQSLLWYTPSRGAPGWDLPAACGPVGIDLGCDDPEFACDPGCAPDWGCAATPVYPAWGGRWGWDHRERAPGWAHRMEGRRWGPWGLRGPVTPRLSRGRPGFFRGTPSRHYPMHAIPRGGAIHRPVGQAAIARSLPVLPRTFARPQHVSRPAARAYAPVRRTPAVHRSTARPVYHGGGGHPASRGGVSHGSRRR